MSVAATARGEAREATHKRRRPGRALLARWVGASVALSAGLGWVPATAHASPNLTWTGMSSTTEAWSSSENWELANAPTSSSVIGTLSFPQLTSTACTVEEQEHPCYISANDLTEVSAQEIQLDDSDNYLIAGEPLALGSGGIDASPSSGSSGPGGAFMLMPLRLTASQRWSVAGSDGGAIEEHGLLEAGGITGSGSALTIEQSHGSALIFTESDTEVGPLTLEGQNTGGGHIENGAVILAEGELNSSDQQPVNLHDVFFTGFGAMGALNTQEATLAIGSGQQPVGTLEATSVTLDQSSGAIFEVDGDSGTPGVDYSQLVANGPVDLDNASFVLFVDPAKKGGSCPTLTPGEKFTLISTSGSLSGSFANAPETGPETPVSFEKACKGPAQTVRVKYNRGGPTRTVTATVEAAAVEALEASEKTATQHEEEAAGQKKREEEATTAKLREEIEQLQTNTKRVAEEVAAGRQREEEAAAAKKLQEEAAMIAKGGVLGVKEASPRHTPTRAQLLAKALKVCGKQNTKRKRAQCEARARKRYGSRRKGTSKRR